MAKKSRRVRLSPTQRYIPTPGAVAPEEARTPAESSAPSVRAAPAVTHLDQGMKEYSHIRADLARMAILAGSLLAALFALRLLVFR
jgi:hypothetical protein